MEPRTFCFIAIFVGSSTFAFLALASPLPATEAPTSEEQKVLLDCRHSDYRTYIKCLKRQKRHHLQHGDSHPEIDGYCMETCLKKCETDHECDQKCSHCLKRTKHKHQIITEYETDCSSGNCEESNDNNGNLRAANITTNIDIKNVINNCPNCASNGSCTSPCTSSVPGNTTTTSSNCQSPTGCYPSSYPSLSIVPQITLVPQITFGLGLGPIGGCSYPYQWPCIQPRQPTYPNPPGQPIDCSGCGNPFLRYKCDVSCYAVQGGQPFDYNHVWNPHSGTPCRSPQCVGGSQ